VTAEFSNIRPSRRGPSATAISAAAAVVLAIVALGTFLSKTSGTSEPEDAVHLQLIEEPMVSDLWTVPSGADERPPFAGDCLPSELEARRQWFKNHDGAATGLVAVRVDVINDSEKTFLVEGLHLTNVEKLPRTTGITYPLCPKGGGGPPSDQYAMVDFDERPLQFRFFNENYQPVPVVDFSPAPHHPLRFWILADSSASHFRWRVDLDYSLGGDLHRLVLPGDNQSFEIGNEAS
jgi:hypothetical protein